jgi:hypothetical protein
VSGWCCVNLSLAVAFFATSAMAADAPAVAVQGSAPPICYLTPPQLGQASNMTLGSMSASQYVLLINQLNDPATAQVRPASISLSLRAICNHAHSLAIQSRSGGLRTATGETPGFSNRVDYSVSVLWGGSSNSLQTSGIAGQSSAETVTPGAFAGTLQLQISVGADGANGLPLLAGIYSDNIVITFKSQM